MRLTRLSPSLSGGGAVGRCSLLSTSKAAVKERTEVSFRGVFHQAPVPPAGHQGAVWFGPASSIGHRARSQTQSAQWRRVDREHVESACPRPPGQKPAKKNGAPQERRSCWEYNENWPHAEAGCFHGYSSTDLKIIEKPKRPEHEGGGRDWDTV